MKIGQLLLITMKNQFLNFPGALIVYSIIIPPIIESTYPDKGV